MRILHVIPQLSGGGAERQLCLLAPEMAKAGHEVHIAYLRDGPEYVQMSAVTLHKISILHHHDPALLFNLFRVVSRVNPAIIQSWILLADVLTGLISKLNKALWVMREPSSSKAYVNKTLKIRLREFLVMRNAAAIIANSESGKANWRGLGAPEVKLNMISNAIPFKLLSDIRLSPVPTLHQKMLVFAGRLTVSKNVDILVKMMPIIVRQMNVILVILGDGPEKSNLMLRVDQMTVSRHIRFMGHLQPYDLWHYMRRAYAFVSLSSYEGMPNAVCEAAAIGTPLILSNIPAHKALFNEESAFFVPLDSVKTISEIILNVLENENEAKNRASKALEVMKGKDPATIAAQYLDLYKRLLNDS